MEKWRKAAVDFGLRPYQVDGAAQIAAAWDEGRRRVLYQLPTGGGKTALGVFWCRETLRQPGKGRRVVWLTHRQELREQSLKELESKGLLVCDLSKTVMAKRRLAAGSRRRSWKTQSTARRRSSCWSGPSDPARRCRTA